MAILRTENRAVGSSRWLVRRLVILEALFLGLIGLAVGLGAELSGFTLQYVWPSGPPVP